MERNYTAWYWVGDDHHEIEYRSSHRARSKANEADAISAIYRQHGRYMALRAEIVPESVRICAER